MRTFTDLTKFGIVVFVLISGFAGYALSIPVEHFAIDPVAPAVLLLGLFFLSSGSFAINQAQEYLLDAKMPRTAVRPLPSGRIEVWQAYAIGILLLVSGFFFLYIVREITAWLGLATVILYNGLYTLYWKKRWVFGAVPGAIPGAMPVVIGYSVHARSWHEAEMVYLFLIMFLWQMPHFWCLAIRYKEDYAKGGIPTLPVSLGVPATLYHMGLYVFAYILVAMAAPAFVKVHFFYLVLVIPLGFKVLYEFARYFQSDAKVGWLRFFMWVNASMIVFLMTPVLDRWLFRWMLG